jgi:hypothetical protein
LEEQRTEWKEKPELLTQYRRDIEHSMNARFPSFYKHSEAQRTSRAMVAELMAKRLNNDAVLVEKLIPKFELGCRR